MNEASAPISRLDTASGLLFLLLVSTFSYSFFYAPGTGDVSLWKQHAESVAELGLSKGYQHQCWDNPPLTFFLFGTINVVSSALHGSWLTVFKASMLVFLFLTVGLFYIWTKDLFLATILQLVLLYNSVGLGYLDIVFAPTFLAALWALERKRLTSFWVLFSITVLIKWQPAILGPFFLIHSYRMRPAPQSGSLRQLRRFVAITWPAWCLGGACIWYFGGPVIEALQRSMIHRCLSGDALNAQWILGFLLQQMFPQFFNGALLDLQNYNYANIVSIPPNNPLWPLKLPFFIVYGLLLRSYLRRPVTFENVLLYSTTLYMSYCTLNTGVHENHFFLLCLLAPVLYVSNNRHKELAAGLMLFANINLLLFYGTRPALYGFGTPPLVDVIFAVLCVGFLIILLLRVRVTKVSTEP